MGRVGGGSLLGRFGTAGPDRGESGFRSCGEYAGVHGTGPWAGAYEADLDRAVFPGGGFCGHGIPVGVRRLDVRVRGG
ncbi:hypothetical protein GCM10022207_59580 [Streptomyces lannensis]|uniref:Uncharacterized protein n=1 Tax=Streptomyces lannensis TaxID=766498 RepID=A0ABP7KQN9_9ACTN